MYCPRCGAEYREGFTRCCDCDVDLVPVPSERPVGEDPEVRLVIVRSFASEFEARLALSALENAGIAATVRTDNEGGLNPGLTFTRGVELLVREGDAAAARDVLSSSR